MRGEREKFGNIQLWNIQMSGKCFLYRFVSEMQNIEPAIHSNLLLVSFSSYDSVIQSSSLSSFHLSIPAHQSVINIQVHKSRRMDD